MADLLNLGEHAQGWVLFFGGKPHLKTEQKTLRPGVFPEETLELKFDALHLQLLLLPNLTATGKYGIWKITEKKYFVTRFFFNIFFGKQVYQLTVGIQILRLFILQKK